MEKKKRNFVEWAMHYRQIVILVVTCLVAFGIYSLPQMRKNEFPDFTVRQGIVVADSSHFSLGPIISDEGVRLALGGSACREDLAEALQKLSDLLHGQKGL